MGGLRTPPLSMIILHVIADLTAGGAEMMLKRLLTAHREHPAFQHRVISLRSLGTVGPELVSLGIPVEALGMTGPLDVPRVLFQLTRRVRRLRADVVHAWMYHANLLGGLAARIGGRGRVAWGIRATTFDATTGVSRSTTWLRRSSGLASKLLPDAIVYVAHAARKAHEALGYSAAKSVVIPNGYAIPKLIPAATARSRLGIPADVLLVGSVGRFNEGKDPKAFVEAAALVGPANPQALFVMVGRGLTPQNATLMGWIAEHGLADRFVLLGERKDVVDCVFAMDIFCLHSRIEAFPNVVAEAMSVAVPCVVTDVGDAALLLGDAGLVVPPRDPAALAGAIEQLIEAGPDQRAAIGRRGRQRIADHFSIEAVVQQYEALYRDLVAKPRTFPSKARR